MSDFKERLEKAAQERQEAAAAIAREREEGRQQEQEFLADFTRKVGVAVRPAMDIAEAHVKERLSGMAQITVGPDFIQFSAGPGYQNPDPKLRPGVRLTANPRVLRVELEQTPSGGPIERFKLGEINPSLVEDRLEQFIARL